MDLINLALQFRDYEWIKELLKQEEEDKVSNASASKNDSAERNDNASRNVKAGLFDEESVALENIINTYAVREKIGIRAFNINSEFDRNLSDLVMLERPAYRKGEKVRFRSPSNEELIFARGIVNGYVLGYSEANNTLNDQLKEYISVFGAQEQKREGTQGNAKRLRKPGKPGNTKNKNNEIK